MKVIGLAGRAGSGKSTIAKHLAGIDGIEWVDLDTVAWSTYASGTDVYDRLVDAFGSAILGESGEIDRSQLASRAFQTEATRQRLNKLVHPAVSNAVRSVIQHHLEEGTRILLIEGALLATSPHVDRSLYDMILWLETPDDVRSQRLHAMGRGHHAKRGKSSVPVGSFISVPNAGSVEDVAHRILKIIQDDGC